MPASILIIEDEPAIQELLAVNLTLAGHAVVRASDAERGLQLVQQELPDLILVDWTLPGQSGVAFIRRMRSEAHTRDVPIIMLTARGEAQDKILGLESGADDYMTKPFSPRELLARIQAVLRRRLPHATLEPIEMRGLRLDPATQRVLAGARPLSLSPIEFRLLHFFMNYPERVHSRAQLLDHVWGKHAFVEERTVDAHVGRLRGALEATGHHVLIETVRGSGYRLGRHDRPLVKRSAGEAQSAS